MWVIIPETEAETYPIDVPLAVVAVAASREGVILPSDLACNFWFRVIGTTVNRPLV